jgi:hypothetical protein
MPSSQECIAQIENALSSGTPLAKDKLAELAEVYAAACRQLNEKMQRCLALLRQGHRDDARRLAQEPPALEQELGLLHFPERDAWLDLCKSAGVSSGPGPDTEALTGVVFDLCHETATLTAIEQIIAPHRQQFAARRYSELAEGMLQFNGCDELEEQCRDLLGQWETISQRTGVQPSTVMQERIAPIRKWLDVLSAKKEKEAAFQSACATLEAGLDANKDRRTLEQLSAAVLSHNQGMPQALAVRLSRRMAELNQKAKQRRVVALVGAGVGLVLLAIVGVIIIAQYTRASERARYRNEIAAAIEKNDMEKAGLLLADLAEKDPVLSDTAEIQAMRGEYDRWRQQEDARLTQFHDLKIAIEAVGPTPADTRTLDQAARLARTPAEKQWVEEWRLKYQQAAKEKRPR